MLRKILTLTVMCAVLANLAMGNLCHGHGEFSSTISQPHIHLGESHHKGHSHDHGCSHHSHSHAQQQTTEPHGLPMVLDSVPFSHDADVIYLADFEVLLPRFQQQLDVALKLSYFMPLADLVGQPFERRLVGSVYPCWRCHPGSECARILNTVRLLL